MEVGTEIRWERAERAGCSVMRPHGELNAITYRQFADDLVEFAMAEPRAVIIVLDDLLIADEPLLTAVSGAWMRVGEWPGVPILVVVGSASRRARLESGALRRFVPVFATVSAAEDAVDTPLRLHACLNLVPAADSAQRARRFTTDVCDRWEVSDVLGPALLIVTEFVENAFLHARGTGDIQVRLELRDDLLTVAVADSDPRAAVLREPGPGHPRFYGLHVVSRLARAWGCVPRSRGGKVVWATLDTGRRRPPPSQ